MTRRIAFLFNVIFLYVTEGAEECIQEIGTGLAEQGCDVTVYGRHFEGGPVEITQEV